MSSIADSSATMSPARTRAPFWTLMLASWPPTSGARRISVARTTPVIGAGGAGRKRRYPPTPAATRTRPSTRILRLPMGAPPLDQGRRHHGEREINECKDPESSPVAHHLPQARAQRSEEHTSELQSL